MISYVNEDIDRIGNYLSFVPYDVTPRQLYNVDTLYGDYDFNRPESLGETYDHEVYRYFLEKGKFTDSPLEALARSLHDHHILKALNQLLEGYDQKHVVGVMGGNAMLRTDESYRKIVRLSKHLTEQGTLMVSGGGPGAMEATNLGGRLAGYDDVEVDKVLHRLCYAPAQGDEGFMDVAFRIVEDYPALEEYENLSIPTWLYGHEPTNPFPTHIAKLFENSVREDKLLTICFGGIVYTPGRAGTMQEIFQEAVQNHYLTFGMASPMIFLGSKFWSEEMPAYRLLSDLQREGKYHNLLLSLTDDENEVVRIIREFQEAEQPAITTE